MKLIHAIAVLGMVTTVAACEKEVILEGDRIDPRDVLRDEMPLDASAPATAISLPAQISNNEWTHRAGTPGHALVNAALGEGTALQWSAPIGQGAGRKHRITADPVIGAGRIYTMDSRAHVVATGTNGATLWQADLTPAADNADDASGGGLAFADGKLFVTTGFGQLVALDAASGAVLWRQGFDAAIGGAPTVSGDMVYVVARDSSSWAIRVADGKVQWQLPGTPSPSGMTGVSAPAVNGRMVVFPFASGELIGALKQGGLQLWQSSVPGARPGRAYAQITDLTGDPVIVGETVYAGSSAGKLAAFELGSGTRIWTATEGTTSPVQVAGGSVFVSTDEGRLVRLDAETGEEIWAVELPYYLKDKIKRQQQIHVHYGPVLAGGRLYLVSSDGLMRVFDPASGEQVATVEIPGGAATSPVIAGRTLYVVNADGKLLAFR